MALWFSPPSAPVGRRGDMIGVARQAISNDFSIDIRAACLGVFRILPAPLTSSSHPSNPSRSFVIGDARAFSGVSFESGRHWPSPRQKPAMAIATDHSSEPPASISRLAVLDERAASRQSHAHPLAHAVTNGMLGPLKPVVDRDLPGARLFQGRRG